MRDFRNRLTGYKLMGGMGNWTSLNNLKLGHVIKKLFAMVLIVGAAIWLAGWAFRLSPFNPQAPYHPANPANAAVIVPIQPPLVVAPPAFDEFKIEGRSEPLDGHLSGKVVKGQRKVAMVLPPQSVMPRYKSVAAGAQSITARSTNGSFSLFIAEKAVDPMKVFEEFMKQGNGSLVGVKCIQTFPCEDLCQNPFNVANVLYAITDSLTPVEFDVYWPSWGARQWTVEVDGCEEGGASFNVPDDNSWSFIWVMPVLDEDYSARAGKTLVPLSGFDELKMAQLLKGMGPTGKKMMEELRNAPVKVGTVGYYGAYYSSSRDGVPHPLTQEGLTLQSVRKGETITVALNLPPGATSQKPARFVVGIK